jgi:hypothetical protein
LVCGHAVFDPAIEVVRCEGIVEEKDREEEGEDGQILRSCVLAGLVEKLTVSYLDSDGT